MARQNGLKDEFYNISRRLISIIKINSKNVHLFDNGTNIAKILKNDSHLYDEIEQRTIASWFS